MISLEKFSELVSDAYHHLYDLVALRTHPLTHQLLSGTEKSGKEKAWEIHTLLINVIHELDPGPLAPIHSAEWRRHRLLEMRFIDGSDPQVVADGLFISRRHFYRELPPALEACAQILWNRFAFQEASKEQSPQSAGVASALDQLRLEAAMFQHNNLSVDVKKVLQGIEDMTKDLIVERGIQTDWVLDDCLPPVRIDGHVLRQIMLGLMNFLFSESAAARIEVVTSQSPTEVLVTVAVESSQADQDRMLRAAQTLALIQELAQINGARLTWLEETSFRFHFLLAMNTLEQRLVLVADDNPDIRRLICSMLRGRYQVLEAANGLEAVRLALEIRPSAILLDLLMPESDGWEALQRLKNSEATASIPVVIFSVLGMRDLALSMGAAGFLDKPVSEKELIDLLDRLTSDD